MPGWGDVLGGLVTALPSLAQSAAGIYATSRMPRQYINGGPSLPSVTPAYYLPSPYIPLTAMAPAMGSMLPVAQRALPALVGGARLIIRGILVRAGAAVGRRVSAAQVVALAKRIGPEAAATALGITLVELYQVMASAQMHRRRRRGITGRQISNARSTIRRMTGFMARVQEACAPASRGYGRRRGRAHRAGCGCVVCRRVA